MVGIISQRHRAVPEGGCDQAGIPSGVWLPSGEAHLNVPTTLPAQAQPLPLLCSQHALLPTAWAQWVTCLRIPAHTFLGGPPAPPTPISSSPQTRLAAKASESPGIQQKPLRLWSKPGDLTGQECVIWEAWWAGPGAQ